MTDYFQPCATIWEAVAYVSNMPPGLRSAPLGFAVTDHFDHFLWGIPLLYLLPPVSHPAAAQVLPTANLLGSTIRLSEHRFVVSHTQDSTSFLWLFVMLMVPRGFQPLHPCLPSPLPLKGGSRVAWFNPWHSVETTLFSDPVAGYMAETPREKTRREKATWRRRGPKEEPKWANVLSALVRTEACSFLEMMFL